MNEGERLHAHTNSNAITAVTKLIDERRPEFWGTRRRQG